MGNLDMATIRDYGKRVKVKVVGKEAGEAKEAVMKAILAAANKAKVEKDVAWVRDNKDMIDWYNEELVTSPEALDAEAPEKDKKDKKKDQKDVLADAKAKAEEAKAKAKVEKGEKKKGSGRGRGAAPRDKYGSLESDSNMSHTINLLIEKGSSLKVIVKELQKKHGREEKEATSKLKGHVAHLNKAGFKVTVSESGVYSF